MKRILISLCILLIITITNLYSAAFERIGLGTTANGMGNAFVAVCDDATALFWNSAGLANLNKDEFYLTYTDLLGLDALNYTYLSYVRAYAGPGTAGFGWTHLGTADGVIPANFKEDTFYLSYGFELFTNFALGVSVKSYLAYYNGTRASAFSVDYGVLYNFYQLIYFGLNYTDANNPALYWYTGAADTIDSNLQLGIYYKMFDFCYFSYELDNLLAGDVENHIGTKITIFNDQLFLLGGIIFYTGGNINYTGGLEFQYKDLTVGYTLIYHYDLGLSNFWSIKIKI